MSFWPDSPLSFSQAGFGQEARVLRNLPTASPLQPHARRTRVEAGRGERAWGRMELSREECVLGPWRPLCVCVAAPRSEVEECLLRLGDSLWTAVLGDFLAPRQIPEQLAQHHTQTFSGLAQSSSPRPASRRVPLRLASPPRSAKGPDSSTLSCQLGKNRVRAPPDEAKGWSLTRA